MEGHGRAHLADRSGRSHGREHRRQQHRHTSEPTRPYYESRGWERGEDRRQCRRGSPAYSSKRAYCGYSRSPPPSTRPRLMSRDRHRRPSETYVVQRGPGEGPYDAPRARMGFSQDHRLCAPHGREAGSLSWGHQPPHTPSQCVTHCVHKQLVPEPQGDLYP